MRSLQNEFVIYIFLICSVTHMGLTHKIGRDLTISVASPTLTHLSKIFGGTGEILSNPLEFVQSFIPKPGCGFNCGSGERNQQFYSHPHGHQHQNNRPHPPAHSNGFHGNPHRQPHPAYGPPHVNNWQSGNFYQNNMPQQNYQYGQYGYYQENSFNLPPVSQNVNYGFNTPSYNPTNNLGFVVNHQHTNFNNPMTNQPNNVENIPTESTNSGFNENPKQTLNTESIITIINNPAQPAIIETSSEISTSINSPTDNANMYQPSLIFEENPNQNLNSESIIGNNKHPVQPSILINSPTDNANMNQPSLIFEENPNQNFNSESTSPRTDHPIQPAIVETTSEIPVIQIIPQLPPTAQPDIVELPKDTGMSLPTTQETIFNQPQMNSFPDLIDTQQELQPLLVHSINSNQETNDFIYPDSARYINENNADVNSQNIYPSIDIRRRRSII